jgi:ribonuclease E
MATVYMAKKMLIDATHPEETRVVVADGNKVDEFDFESINKRQLAGNIYLAKVTRVEPSLQAAFVDYGGNRHGFLAFSEIHPDYYQIPVADRQALLAEEAAEQESSSTREDEGEDKSKSRSRRGKRRTRSTPTENSAENPEVKGLEVIDLSGEESGGDTGVTPEEDDFPHATPRSIAESAGLDDEDSVSEDVIDTAPQVDAVEETAPPKAKPARTRAKRTPKKAVTTEVAPEEVAPTETAPTESAPEEVAPTEAATTEAAPKKKAAARKPRAKKATVKKAAVVPTDDAAETGAADQGDADKTATAAEAGDFAAEQPVASDEKKPARARGRRSRTDDAEAPDAVEAVESIGQDDPQEDAAKDRARRRSHYKIQDVVKVRQIMLVQVVKEERGNKGAALTTYLSLAGRYCVLMPNTARGGGISRKITNVGDRKRLREITDQLDVPKGIGLIVRTAGAERTGPEIKRDYEFLIRQWEQVRELTLKSIAPALIYEEGSLIKRSIRDLYSDEIETILVEGEAGYHEAHDYMKMLMPSHAKNVQRYDEQIPLYIRYQVESYLNGMFNPTVQLRSGGYIVIGVTEALVAIDVNSGRSTKESSIEETALKTNLEAAEEVVRQLRLRDLAGLIVIDFIDMDDNRNNRAVEKRMKDRLKSDRARIQVGRISAFGLMEMSRQRLRPGMIEATTQPCPHCLGQGIVRSDDNLALSILREVEEEGVRGRAAEVTVTTPIGISNYIMNMKRVHLAGIEKRYGMAVTVIADPVMISPEFRIERANTQSRQIDVPDMVITAESVAASVSVETAEVQAASAPEARPAAARSPEEKPDEKSEGKSRRRRGKRGGQRRRREEDETGAEDNAGQPREATDEASPAASGGTDAVKTEGAEGDGNTSDGNTSDERRSRRRRGGRGRSRRADGDAAAETVVVGTDEYKVTERAIESGTVDAAPVVPDQPEPVATVTPDAADYVDISVLAAETAMEPVSIEPTPVEPVIVAEALVEPVSEPEPEPVAATPAEPEPEKPAAPKRRGWWARG